MQVPFLRRPVLAAATKLLPVLILSASLPASAAFGAPFRPSFDVVSGVTCPLASPLPRPLIDAAACGDLPRVRARLKERSDVSATDLRPGFAGRTALHHAAQRGDVEMAAMLLQAGADPDAVDGNGNTPLHLLARREAKVADAELARRLIDAGADARVRNARGRTALGELLAIEMQRVHPLRLAPPALASLLDEAEASGPRAARAVADNPVAPAAPDRSPAAANDVVPVSVQIPATDPATQAPAGEGDAGSAVRATLDAWAGAWSAADVAGYLGHYAADFRPAGGKTLEAWRAQRRERLANADGLHVTLADVEIVVEGERATARFVQDYRSRKFNAVDRKRITLVRDGRAWKIVEEAASE